MKRYPFEVMTCLLLYRFAWTFVTFASIRILEADSIQFDNMSVIVKYIISIFKILLIFSSGY